MVTTVTTVTNVTTVTMVTVTYPALDSMKAALFLPFNTHVALESIRPC